MRWHRKWERPPSRMALGIIIVIAVASLARILPMLFVKSGAPIIASVQPYTPLELAGRDVYVAEGCFACHPQMVRPMRHETERFGSCSLAGEFICDRTFQWGSRRIGPDLHRIGQRTTSVLWHITHLRQPAHGGKRAGGERLEQRVIAEPGGPEEGGPLSSDAAGSMRRCAMLLYNASSPVIRRRRR